MKTLTTVTYLHEADMICSKLQADGIEAFMPDESVIAVNPLYANAVGGIRIQVNESDFERAEEILQNLLSGSPLPEEPGDELEVPDQRPTKTDLRIFYGAFAILLLAILATICKHFLQYRH